MTATDLQTVSCGVCGTWECGECGNKSPGRNRFFPWAHACPKCKSTEGRMLPTNHRPRKAVAHNDDFPDMHASMGAPRYPLEEPVSEYPEHDKLRAVQADSEIIGQFLEESGFVLAEYVDVGRTLDERLLPVQKSTEQILAAYFKIDLTVVDQEKQQMLAAMRELNNGAKPSGKEAP